MEKSKELSKEQRVVLEAIKSRPGRRNTVSMSMLASLVYGNGLPFSTRRLQKVIHDLTRLGYPIGSSTGKPNGYYLIVDLEELRRTMSQLDHRIMNLSRRRAALRKHEAKMLGQESMKYEG